MTERYDGLYGQGVSTRAGFFGTWPYIPVEAEPTGKRQREQGELEGSLREAGARELETHSLWLSIGSLSVGLFSAFVFCGVVFAVVFCSVVLAVVL